MDVDTQKPAGRREPPADGATAKASAGIFDGAGELVQELRGVAHDYLTLAALETKRAGQSLVIMIAAGVMMAILLVSAWLGVVAAGVFGMVAGGMALWVALLLAVVANIVVAAALYAVIHYKRRYLGFPATMRNLRPGVSGSTRPHHQPEGVH